MKMKLSVAKSVVQFLRALAKSVKMLHKAQEVLNCHHHKASTMVLSHDGGGYTKTSERSSVSNHGRKNSYGLITIHTSPSWLNLDFDNINGKGQEEECSNNTTSAMLSTASSSAQEVDKLAEDFIQNFYEKMRLEKQHSYRKYEEMLARGV